MKKNLRLPGAVLLLAACILVSGPWAAATYRGRPDRLMADEAPADAPPQPLPDVATVEVNPYALALSEAWVQIRRQNWPAAQEQLNAVLQAPAGDAVHAEARFAYGYLWHHRRPGESLDRAREMYQSVLDHYAHTTVAPWALLTLARMEDLPPAEERDVQRLLDQRETARRMYRELIERFPRHVAAHEAALRLGMSYLERLEDDASIDTGMEILARYVEENPGNYLASAMHFNMAWIHQRRGQYREAVERYIAADRAGIPGANETATTYYRIAQIAERELQDYELAIEWYDRLAAVDEYGRPLLRDSRVWVARGAAARLRQMQSGASGELTSQGGDR